ncbi:MAG: hypothetical protein V1647_06855 [Pseudomonadota bacterium]
MWKKSFLSLFFINFLLMFFIASCELRITGRIDAPESNTGDNSGEEDNNSGDATDNTEVDVSVAPVLDDLVVEDTDASSIVLERSTLSTAGNPAPTVLAYIGVDGVISVRGSVVSNSVQGPVDISSEDHQFSDLDPYTNYRIIVVARNSKGYSVKEIAQSTDGIAPALNNLVVGSFDSSSITVQEPTLTTAGNPAPTVRAYIGVDGAISASGSAISSSLQEAADVSSGSHQFSGLDPYTNYRIIVVAQNDQGYSVKQIAQSTAGIAPILNNLAVGSFDSSSVTLTRPSFSTAGNPTPTVSAYIGVNGVISISGATVSSSVQGPIDVSSGDYQFNGLSSYTNYRVIVVAQNDQGYSVKQIAQNTAGIAPVLNALAIEYSAVTTYLALNRPTFSTTGNPTPTVAAYIGVDGVISVSDSEVRNSTEGPIDMSLVGKEFSGLSNDTTYRIVVVARNIVGYSVKQITHTTPSSGGGRGTAAP